MSCMRDIPTVFLPFTSTDFEVRGEKVENINQWTNRGPFQINDDFPTVVTSGSYFNSEPLQQMSTAYFSDQDGTSGMIRIGTYKDPSTMYSDEATLLGSFDHPNILKPVRELVSVDQKRVATIYEECGQSLHDTLAWLDNHKWVTPEGAEVPAKAHALTDPMLVLMHLCNEVMPAIDYIHSMGYVHMDLSPHTIFICDDGVWRVGPSRFMMPVGTKINNSWGTHRFTAPEYVQLATPSNFENGEIDVMCFADHWGLGKTISMIMEMRVAILELKQEEKPTRYSCALKALRDELVSFDWNDRTGPLWFGLDTLMMTLKGRINK